MTRYEAFGLSFSSELPLPELVAAPLQSLGEADVEVRLAPVRDVLWSPQPGVPHDAQVAPHEAFFFWAPVGTFAVRGGREILVDPAPGVSDSLLRLPLLGAVMASVLEQRGDFVLHAGAVEAGPGAGVFLGWKGAGKSTMTAGLFKRGHRLLSDDVVALRWKDGVPLIYPGFAQFKLWPDSAEGALGEDAAALPELYEQSHKRARHVEGFSLQPSPLRRLFALEAIAPDDADEPPIQLDPLSARESVPHLITNSYAARWGNALLQGENGAQHFQRCVQLANAVPMLRLRRRMEMALLPQVVGLVAAEIAGSDAVNA